MVKVTFDTQAFERQQQEMLGRIRNASYAFNLIAAKMEAETLKRFKTATAPDGSRWQPLAESTVRQRRKGSSVPLNDTGVLKNSIAGSGKGSAKAATVSTNIGYAAVHNFGGRAGRGGKVKIPRRQFMWLSQAEIKRYQATLANYIVEGN